MGETRITARLVTSRQMAARWLTHPVSLAALVVMALNDHILKAQFGSWWTGKLSDVAGLVLFPALLALAIAAVAPRLQPKTVSRAALVSTLLGFAAVKVTAVGAASASAVLTFLFGPSQVLRDPTDLIALASLLVAAKVAARCRAAGPAPNLARWRAIVVAPVAVLASVATGPAAQPHAVALENVDGHWALEVANARPYEETVWAVQAGPDPQAWITWAADRTRALTPTVLSCAAGQPDFCARAVDGQMAVEISADGGETWQMDWHVSQSAATQLGREYDAGALVTTSVAVIDGSDGPAVIAANGRDGLAVRDSAGTWERVGFVDVPGVVNHRLAALSPDQAAYVMPAWLGWIALGMAVAFATVAGVASWLSVRSSRRLWWSVPVLVAAVVAGLWAAAENHAIAMAVGNLDPGLALLVGLSVAALLLVGATGVVLDAYRRPVALPAWGGALTGVATGAAVGTWASGTGLPLWVQALVVAGAALAASAPWCMVLFSRHHRRAREIPRSAPVEPLSEGPGAIGEQ